MTQEQTNAAFIRRVERITGMPTSADAVGEKELDELQEAFDWWIGESSPWILCDVLRRASEADALRAKLAEVEGERDNGTVIRINAAVCVHCDEFIGQSGVGNAAVAAGLALMVEHDAQCEKHPGNVRAAAIATRIAASQAEAKALREALRLTSMSVPIHVPVPGTVCVCAMCVVHANLTPALATPPGDDAALREVCRKVAEAADANPDLTLDEMVNKVLGPTATDASEGGNG